MLLAGPISHISIQNFQYFAEFVYIYLLVLVGAELPLCVVATPSQNVITCFLESS